MLSGCSTGTLPPPLRRAVASRLRNRQRILDYLRQNERVHIRTGHQLVHRIADRAEHLSHLPRSQRNHFGGPLLHRSRPTFTSPRPARPHVMRTFSPCATRPSFRLIPAVYPHAHRIQLSDARHRIARIEKRSRARRQIVHGSAHRRANRVTNLMLTARQPRIMTPGIAASSTRACALPRSPFPTSAARLDCSD